MVPVTNTFRQALAAGAPQRIALVFDTLSGVVYDNKIISNEDIDVEGGVDFREVFCSEQDLAIGLTPAGEISFAVFNDDGHYDNFNFGKFDAFIGVRTAVQTGQQTVDRKRPALTYNKNYRTLSAANHGIIETYELCPMGRFIAPIPSIIRKTLIDVQAYDQMTLFDVDMPSASELQITYPITAGALLQALCDQAGVAVKTYTFLNSDLTLNSEPSSFADSTMREVLGWIAEAAGANACFNRFGQLEFKWLTAQTSSFSENSYVEFEPARYTVPLVDRLHVRNEDSTAETVIGSGDNTYMLQNNPFLRQEDVAQGFSVLLSPTRISVYAGDTVTFTPEVLGATSPTYLWQTSANNVAWTDTAVTTAEYSFTASAITCANYYRVAVTENGNTVYSNSAKATLKGVTA